jgi:hypothetical protein
MNRLICRDCGLEQDVDARGCPRCALNFEAERMIDRIVWQRIVPAVILVVLIGAVLIYLSR